MHVRCNVYIYIYMYCLLPLPIGTLILSLQSCTMPLQENDARRELPGKPGVTIEAIHEFPHVPWSIAPLFLAAWGGCVTVSTDICAVQILSKRELRTMAPPFMNRVQPIGNMDPVFLSLFLLST